MEAVPLEAIQALVDAAPEAENYCTDGYFGYVSPAKGQNPLQCWSRGHAEVYLMLCSFRRLY